MHIDTVAKLYKEYLASGKTQYLRDILTVVADIATHDRKQLRKFSDPVDATEMAVPIEQKFVDEAGEHIKSHIEFEHKNKDGSLDFRMQCNSESGDKVIMFIHIYTDHHADATFWRADDPKHASEVHIDV